MSTDDQPAGLLDKVLRKENLIFLVGLFSLGSGFYTGETMQYFWGIMIMLGAVLLHFVRKKDWKKHWEEQEEARRRMVEIEERRRKGGDGDA